ncbi:hypothetical protein SLEP1_g37052 [Rubroshorea leprosula]|uniref:Integrase catalytic domain-containing protein n=1 Tax=Rubroshorea leprosula TaxID=152421 RepID=A0AAV5KTY0_9ROSI|nr:hypothetical protein SLEP1_g37052 [Rubroshorea leprosula]
MCIDYTNLNDACPKDCHLMPNIDKLVEVASRNERLSLLDAYLGYHQVHMAPEDEVKTTFYAGDEIYCYVMMPFGVQECRSNISRNGNNRIPSSDRYSMKLNPVKCTFGVELGKFLGVIVSRRGIEVNLKKIKAIEEMKPPRSTKDMQRLTGWVAALHRLSNNLDELKAYLSSPPLLTKAKEGTEEAATILQGAEQSSAGGVPDNIPAEVSNLRYGIPNQIIANNGPQFNCNSVKDFCSSYGIKLVFTSVCHPEANGMVESVNKAIIEGIKPSSKKGWLVGFETHFGKLALNWEGPYVVNEIPHPGAYILQDSEGKRVPRV